MNSARRLAIASRIVDPHLNTPTWFGGKQARRPIPIDKSLIGREVDRMVASVMKLMRSLPDQPIGKQDVHLESIELSNARGEKKEVWAILIARPGSGRDLLLDAGYSQTKFGDSIVIWLNGGLTPTDFQERLRELRQGIWKVVIHEMTHVIDLSEGGSSGEVAPKTMDEWVRYFNLPREVRAYMQEIVDQVVKAVPRGHAGRVDQKLIDRALAGSRTWKEIGQLFSSTNRKKILQAVYAAVNDVVAET